jgi:hypothetical protein
MKDDHDVLVPFRAVEWSVKSEYYNDRMSMGTAGTWSGRLSVGRADRCGLVSIAVALQELGEPDQTYEHSFSIRIGDF